MSEDQNPENKKARKENTDFIQLDKIDNLYLKLILTIIAVMLVSHYLEHPPINPYQNYAGSNKVQYTGVNIENGIGVIDATVGVVRFCKFAGVNKPPQCSSWSPLR